MTDKRAVATVQVENAHLRVTEWRFTPGAATGYHRHAYDYVVVPVVDGELELIGPMAASRVHGSSKANPISAMPASSMTSSTPVQAS
jgi:hypothetical protein